MTKSLHTLAAATALCGAALQYDAMRLCVLLHIGFHVFRRTGEMLQVRTADFVGDTVAGPWFWFFFGQNRASDVKTFLTQLYFLVGIGHGVEQVSEWRTFPHTRFANGNAIPQHPFFS